MPQPIGLSGVNFFDRFVSMLELTVSPPYQDVEFQSMIAGFFKRIATYIWEMYPPYRIAPLVLIQFFGFFYTLALIAGMSPVIDWSLGPSVLTIFLIWFLLRCFDELKDQDIDAECFPHRPVVRGATSYNDIRIMILLNIMTLVFLNIGKGMVTDAFMVMLIYMILSWQWYLFEPIIAPNIFLVLLTHQPWLPLNQIYIYAVFATTQQVSLEWYKVLGAIVLFWLPGGMLLEIGRKIRAPEQEDTYLSYTKRWGLRPALTFLLGINIATSGAWFLFSLWMGLSVLFASLFPVLSMIFTMVVLAFLKNPRKSNNHINLMCQVYVGIVLVFPLLAYLVK